MKSPVLPCGSPKERSPNVYYNDGVGRDTYISFNNGGNFQPEMRFLLTGEPRSTLKISVDQMFRPLQNQYPQRIQYFSNGSGRDSYIQQTVQDKFTPGYNFKKQLRKYESNYGQSPKVQGKLPPIMKDRLTKHMEVQKKLLARLTVSNLKTKSLATLNNDI